MPKTQTFGWNELRSSLSPSGAGGHFCLLKPKFPEGRDLVLFASVSPAAGLALEKIFVG